jgi:cytochrome c oxidase cbb3-type subunit 3
MKVPFHCYANPIDTMQNLEFSAAAVLLLLSLSTAPSTAQAPAATATPQSSAPAPVRRGGFAREHHALADPAQIAHGKALYGVNCAGCHGVDLRGGDLGGPNLLRSQVALSDENGELILPIIQGSRRESGMPAIPISQEDAMAVAAYIRSVVETLGSQGRPPSIGMEAPSILVGDAAAGQAYFAQKCASCHSATGDLQGVASRFSDPKALQTVWVAGGRRRFLRAASVPARRAVTVSVTLPSGERIEGRLARIDDFLVTVLFEDGSTRTIPREGGVPKVEIHDPMQAHRDLLAVYTDKDVHDVTAYLVTLK